MTYLDEQREKEFRKKIDTSVAKVKTILDITRKPQSPSEIDHSYDDKYALAEFLTKTTTAATINVLELLGLQRASLVKLKDLYDNHKKSVTLRFAVKETCSFIKEKEVKMDNPEVEIESSSKNTWNKQMTKSRAKVILTVKKYYWKYDLQYILFAYAGNDPDAAESSIKLHGRSSSYEIVISGNKESPYPGCTISDPINLSLDWILEHIDLDSSSPTKQYDNTTSLIGTPFCKFTINRSAKSCRTPRRNDNINDAIDFYSQLKSWANHVRNIFVARVSSVLTKYPPPTPSTEEKSFDIHSINDNTVFIPILSLFEDRSTEPTSKSLDTHVTLEENENPDNSSLKQEELSLQDETRSSLLLPLTDIDKFLQEHIRTLEDKIEDLDITFQGQKGNELISAPEAKTTLLMIHLWTLANSFHNSVYEIEFMLESQLLTAIGKDLQASDFEEFFRSYHKKFLIDEFQPQPFCYSIRRPNHYPDGILSIESENSEKQSEPILTLTKKINNDTIEKKMHFAINAATNIEFLGNIYLHAWILHDFKGSHHLRPCNPGSFRLAARAKQFSNFLLMIGKISGPDSFEPQHAIIIQNKDEVLIPLLLNQLPTSKEFKDAIESLSPEQKEFATAIRNAQLESSVFGICIIQLKPQLEKLLGLPNDALTKEVKLTQNLLSLFIDYQIPSDLLTYDGDDEATLTQKLDRIKENVATVQQMISDTKDEQLKDAEQQSDMFFEQKMQNDWSTDESTSSGMMFGAAPTVRCAISQQSDMVFEQNAWRPDKSSLPRMMFGAAPAVMNKMSMPVGDMSTKSVSRNRVSTPVVAKNMMRKSKRIMQKSLSVNANSFQPMTKSFLNHTESVSRSDDGIIATNDKNITNDVIQMNDAVSNEIDYESSTMDLTMIPKLLDKNFDILDEDSALRPTIVKLDEVWERRSQRNLILKELKTDQLGKTKQRTEKNMAFDLLDCLSRSGSLQIESAELHVLVAATHCFDKSVLDTVIQDNINPIAKLEKSVLIVASTIFGTSPASMLKNAEHVARIATHAPRLFNDNALIKN